MKRNIARHGGQWRCSDRRVKPVQISIASFGLLPTDSNRVLENDWSRGSGITNQSANSPWTPVSIGSERAASASVSDMRWPCRVKRERSLSVARNKNRTFKKWTRCTYSATEPNSVNGDTTHRERASVSSCAKSVASACSVALRHAVVHFGSVLTRDAGGDTTKYINNGFCRPESFWWLLRIRRSINQSQSTARQPSLEGRKREFSLNDDAQDGIKKGGRVHWSWPIRAARARWNAVQLSSVHYSGLIGLHPEWTRTVRSSAAFIFTAPFSTRRNHEELFRAKRAERLMSGATFRKLLFAFAPFFGIFRRRCREPSRRSACACSRPAPCSRGLALWRGRTTWTLSPVARRSWAPFRCLSRNHWTRRKQRFEKRRRTSPNGDDQSKRGRSPRHRRARTSGWVCGRWQFLHVCRILIATR